MSAARLVARQVRFTNKSFWRNVAAAVFTFAFPLMFLVILSLLFRGGDYRLGPGRTVKLSTFYVPAIAAFGVISACYTNVAMMVTLHRERGILKRLRATPMPAWAYLAARVLHAVLIGGVLVAICVGFGAVAYGVIVPSRTLAPFLVTLLVGAATFCALGLAITAFIPSAEATSPIVNATILPLLFVSNVFVPLEHPPGWLDAVTGVFPVRHLADALVASYAGVGGFRWGDLLVMAVWGAGALLVAIRWFRWEPRA